MLLAMWPDTLKSLVMSNQTMKSNIRPVVFTDLDDTLFQTKRKMLDEIDQIPVRIGALDRSMAPRSFMNDEQALLVDWLLANAEVIPVTARGTDEYARVQIPFNSWAITTHGAVILSPDGQCDTDWQQQIVVALHPYHQRLLTMQEEITLLMAKRGIDAWARINYEYDGVPIYLVLKHTDSTKLEELNLIGDAIEEIFGTKGFYIHRNSNNIAWLPNCIEKGKATSYLLNKLNDERGTFPTIGLGDSITDFSFLKLCSWYGVPKQSQFSSAIKTCVFGE
jgi:predicted mannosyl-3-phosphoglycerate phosphatase (HAD superfamily)